MCLHIGFVYVWLGFDCCTPRLEGEKDSKVHPTTQLDTLLDALNSGPGTPVWRLGGFWKVRFQESVLQGGNEFGCLGNTYLEQIITQ